MTRILRSPISTNRTSLGMATFALENFLRAVGVPSGRDGRPPVAALSAVN